ncbi:MAG: thioredoxin [Oscillospiraceae bacterium]|jgi:thioredoxin 1|nr:thioredoxin [Oscillospiraceae bacterium]
MIEILKENDFEKKVTNSKGIVVVDFFAVWCGPCKSMMPILEETSRKFEGKVKIFKTDIDELKKISENFGIMSVPTFIIFSDGKEISRQSGAVSASAFEGLIESAISDSEN